MFSPREEKIIKIIEKRRKASVKDICTDLFKSNNSIIDPVVTVHNCINKIIRKCSFHKLDWTLVKNRSNNKLVINKEKVK